MYGGRFLSAHFSGTYHLKKSTVTNGLHFERTKNSHKNLIERFDLTFDFETYLSTFDDESLQKRDKIILNLRRLKNSNVYKDIDELATICDVSTQYLYKLFSRELKSHIDKKANANGRKTLYLYTGI